MKCRSFNHDVAVFCDLQGSLYQHPQPRECPTEDVSLNKPFDMNITRPITQSLKRLIMIIYLLMYFDRDCLRLTTVA